ncbi:MAG: hypothetical protein ACR2NM_06460 [Bythopirellula sp.]
MTAVTEGKAELTRRLTAEGRWGVASARKDEIANDLRVKGMKRSQSNAEAWKRIAKEFPPLTRVELNAKDSAEMAMAEPEETIDLQLFAGLPESTADSFESDTWWVLNNLGAPEVDFGSAPSRGCIAIFSWAKRQPDQFVARVVSVVGKYLKENVPECEECARRRNEEKRNVEFVGDLKRKLGMVVESRS